MATATTKPIACCSQVNTGHWCQETYETAAREAGRRVRQLKRVGYEAYSDSLGPQVTPLGVIKLSIVSIRPGDNRDTWGLPDENWRLVEWPRN